MPTSVRVLLPLPLPAFTYLPAHGQALPEIGQRVVVPWQHGIRLGIAVGHQETRGAQSVELREVIATLDEQPFVSAQALAALERMADHTCLPAGLVLANLLPYGLNIELEHEVRALVEDLGIPKDSFVPAAGVAPAQLELWRAQGLVAERVRPLPAFMHMLNALKPIDDQLAGARRTNWRHALKVLWERGPYESAAALARDADVPESAVRSLITKGYAGYARMPAPPPSLPSYPGTPLPPSSLCLPATRPVLSLSGGRRRDRLAALLPLLQRDVHAGGSILVLVPEQALLTETAGALSNHLPVLALMGDLSDRQRERLWDEVQAGEPKVLVATYLGLLAPLPELARVVVLEEAANSYKLPSGARLFIPTVARLLAETHGVPLVLADALPNPESRWRLPPEACIDLGASDARLHVTDLTQASNWPVAGDLIRVLRQVQDRERQAVVLASRRGFSAALSCSECRWLAMCPNCDLPLRYNQERYRLRCHQCGHSETAPRACPSCRSHHLLPSRAAGTQWVAREISKLLPGFCVRRYDGDRRDDLSGLLAGEPGIVVGTSAILRHPPLPKVSLVAVTLLDTALNLSDFRAEEEAYRLLSNLAELAPASRPLTVVQTFQPDHPVLEAFAGGDAAAFVQSLLARRERFGYPPFSAMAKVQISARQRSTAQNAAAWLARAISTAGAATRELLGPAPAPVARIRNQYSFQLFVRAADHARLQLLLQPALAYHGTARVRVEVDPRDVSEFLE